MSNRTELADRHGLGRQPVLDRVFTWMPRYALLVLLVVLLVVFSLWLPGTFLTVDNIVPTLAIQSVAGLLALAVMVPLAANSFDLSVGYNLGLCNIVCIGLQVKAGWHWPQAVVATIVVGAVVGLVNGLLTQVLKIDSFIATLGSGSVCYAISLLYTGGQSLVGQFPDSFTAIGLVKGFIPFPTVYLVVIAVLLWLMFEFLPFGRKLYVIGSSPKTALLLGIKSASHIIVGFVIAGVIAAVAGVVLAAQLQSAQATTGPDYLLPAFAAVFLGTTAFKLGRVNVWGTVLAVLVLATIVTGLQQVGLAAWVQPLVNGVMLIGAVGLSALLQRFNISRAGSRAIDTRERVAEAATKRESGSVHEPAGRG